MTLQVKVEDFLRMAQVINEVAPGGCIDLDAYQPQDIRDHTGQIIGRVDLGMEYVHWFKREDTP